MERRIYRIVDIEPIVTKDEDDYEVGILTCYLENGDNFTLYNVPPEIARAIAKIMNYEEYLEIRGDNRSNIYELLIMLAPEIRFLGKSINKVVIDGFNSKTLTYSASLFLEIDGVKIRKVMIPSHAIFIALLFNRPIYVTEEVLRISKELEEEDEGYS